MPGDDTKRPLKVSLLPRTARDREPVADFTPASSAKAWTCGWIRKNPCPGANWKVEIRKAVREADVVVVCLSKQLGKQAGFRQKEVRIALDAAMEKPEGEIFIIPARLEECDNLESLSKWHWVDLFESDGFQRLILALHVRADKIGAALRQRGGVMRPYPTRKSRRNRKLQKRLPAKRKKRKQSKKPRVRRRRRRRP